MKNAFSILFMTALIALFASLSLFMFEIKSIKSENLKNEYLQTQAWLHLQFLTELSQRIQDKEIQHLQYEEDQFVLSIEVYQDRYELFVHAKDFSVSLHKTVIK